MVHCNDECLISHCILELISPFVLVSFLMLTMNDITIRVGINIVVGNSTDIDSGIRSRSGTGIKMIGTGVGVGNWL